MINRFLKPGASRQLLRISCIYCLLFITVLMLKLRNPSLTWPATCSSMSVTTWPLAQPWKGMSAARMTVRVSANSCRHISRAVCRSRVTCHVSPRVPATHLALLLLEVGPLLLLLGLQHHLGTRHLLALPRPAATIRYDDIRSGIRGPAPSGRQLVFAGEGIEDSVGPDILQAGLVLHRELVSGPASPSSLVLQTINRCTITEKAPTRAFSWLKVPTK